MQAVARDGRIFPVELSIKPVFLEEQLVFTLYLRDIAEVSYKPPEQKFAVRANSRPAVALVVTRS